MTGVVLIVARQHADARLWARWAGLPIDGWRQARTLADVATCDPMQTALLYVDTSAEDDGVQTALDMLWDRGAPMFQAWEVIPVRGWVASRGGRLDAPWWRMQRLS